MSRKKKKQEEIIKTHVLNLKEIREAEKKDKKERRKKIPGLFFGIGIILIVLGLCISFLIAKVFNNSPKTTPVKKDKTKLTCISNLKENIFLTKIHTETKYSFKNGKISYSKTTSSITQNGNINKLTDLINNFHLTGFDVDGYNDPNNGITYKLIPSNNKINVEYAITYNKYIDNSKVIVYDTFLSQPTLSSNDTYETVKQKSEKLGSLCN